MTNLKVGILFTASYLLGGIPTGYIIGRLKGIDIRQHGSGNPGTANVYRTLGKLPGIITFAVDFLKGFAPAMVAMHFFYMQGSGNFSKGHWWIPVTAGALAIAGHIWTVFLSFHGGKGVATAAGVFMALLPVPTAAAFAVFAVAVAITKHISVGSMSAAVALPLLCLLLTDKHQRPFTLLALAVCALLFYTHIANIRRILKGKELPFHHRKDAAAGGGKAA
ncbi:MAG: acyl-phosphate glycerol 3-phosphate acyltransferase [Elusimicrobia bacterium RIFOXYA2_FULL_58_8]|nr:MAG: acyl-phosphate glycerol 3-phosphate acyltransferase [Elusimicrobia bacterium RIFOXYA12_FULL_57_11]OGS13449.1 MAG: acyl-phosphate glycerol 3-phosphate acyltransferase [Elusimicrobia bacterium RIFOXYA2_FULL_58_8]